VYSKFTSSQKPRVTQPFARICARNSSRINTSRIFRKSRISLIPLGFNPTRINTSGAKDLKSRRINTYGNKDLKSFTINTSKKHRRGGGPRAFSSLPKKFAPFAACALLPESPIFARFCYPQFVRIPKFLIFLPMIAAGALLAHAGSASQTVSPTPSATATPAAPQSAPPAAPPTATPSVAVTAPFVVVLDPAHGGADPGAHGSSGINESDVVLSLARQIRSALQVEGISVLLTRDADIDPSFDDRSAIANAQARAIFLSLHVSSTGVPGTVRVYSLPSTPPQTPAQQSMQSAAGLLPPPVAQPNPHPNLRSWSNAQQSFLDLSHRLAELMQSQMAQRFRGSPQTPAIVAVRQLRTIAAPAIAVELSSVSVADRRQLDAMDAPVADAIVRAVLDFEPSYVPIAPAVAPEGAHQ
jgi:N-acetylmuramoyl-L-alanine amidase